MKHVNITLITLFAVTCLLGTAFGERGVDRVKIMKSDFKALKFCLKALSRQIDDIRNNDLSKYKHLPPLVGMENLDTKIAETADINNYACSISEHKHNVYYVGIGLKYGGIGGIDEKSQWYDSTTYEFLGWHSHNPREKDKMVVEKYKRKEEYISAEFLNECASLIEEMELALKRRYSPKKRVVASLSDISNYDVVIVEHDTTYDVMLLEKKTGWPFDNKHNVMYRVNRKGCEITDKIQTRIWGLDYK